LRVHHTGLSVTDIERSVAFYSQAFGMTVVHRRRLEGPDIGSLVGVPGAILEIALLQVGEEAPEPIDAPVDRLELIQYVTPPGRPFDRSNNEIGTAHLALVVEHIEAAYEHLRLRGVTFNCPPQVFTVGRYAGWKGTYMRDPDGITIELLQPPSSS